MPRGEHKVTLSLQNEEYISSQAKRKSTASNPNKRYMSKLSENGIKEVLANVADNTYEHS